MPVRRSAEEHFRLVYIVMPMRADLRLVELGLVPSRARAQAEIKAGSVRLGRRRIERPSESVPRDAILEIAVPANPWVSRGGLKLAHGLDHFAFDVTCAVALDIGASTGGFTQVLLARGATKVYAIDVGHGQLHECVRQDPRVAIRESINARDLDEVSVPERLDLIVADVSFISLRLVLPPALALTKSGAKLLVLVKPQFEVGPGIAVKGIVREAEHRETALRGVADSVGGQPGWALLGITPSPIPGGDGNEEFLLAAQRS